MTEKEKFLEMIRLHEGWIPGKSWQSQMVERVDFLLSELDRVTAERDAQRNANGLLGQERDEARAQVAQLREVVEEVVKGLGDVFRSKPPDSRPWWYVRLDAALSATGAQAVRIKAKVIAFSSAKTAAGVLVTVELDDGSTIEMTFTPEGFEKHSHLLKIGMELSMASNQIPVFELGPLPHIPG